MSHPTVFFCLFIYLNFIKTNLNIQTQFYPYKNQVYEQLNQRYNSNNLFTDPG